MPIDFDTYSENYQETVNNAIALTGADVDYYAGIKAQIILDILQRRFSILGQVHVLNVGCGVGLLDQCLISKVGRFAGIDISEKSVGQAAKANSNAEYRHYNGRSIPFPNESFDFVLAICIMHHIHVDQRQQLVREMARVIRRGGYLFIYEHNPLNLVVQYIVSRCELDRNAVLLSAREVKTLIRQADLKQNEMRYTSFVPIQVPWIMSLEKLVSWLPLGGQFFVMGKKD